MKQYLQGFCDVMACDDNAIRRANKLGAKGIMVTGYIEPQTASQDPQGMPIIEIPPKQNADETAWYEL